MNKIVLLNADKKALIIENRTNFSHILACPTLNIPSIWDRQNYEEKTSLVLTREWLRIHKE
jgi:hypothetical protein